MVSLGLQVIEYIEGPHKVLSWQELQAIPGTAFENSM